MKRDYNDPVYKAWRKSVYSRDKFTCQMPGCKSKKSLQAHHIRKWSTASSLRYEKSNGITLCRNCHNSISGSEHIYEKLFMEIVSNNGS
jgi:5-methylcytosine-specific restriction endonuclease McrA